MSATEPEYAVVSDELEALESIFCQDGEFVLHDFDSSTGTACFTVSSTTSQSKSLADLSFSAKFFIHPGYPQTLPQINVTSDSLTRKGSEDLKKDLLTHAREHLLGEPMTMQMLEWIQEHLRDFTSKEEITTHVFGTQEHLQDDWTVTLLRLDHMRARSRYVRTLLGWAADLSITGRILFVHKLILVLLEGHSKSVKEFIMRLRTQKVDVDSSGKSCKEKMMTVLREAPSVGNSPRFESFDVAEFRSMEELKAALEMVDLTLLYEEDIAPLLRHCSEGKVR